MRTRGCTDATLMGRKEIVELKKWIKIIGEIPKGTLVMMKRNKWQKYPVFHNTVSSGIMQKMPARLFVGVIMSRDFGNVVGGTRYRINWIGKQSDGNYFSWNESLCKIIGFRKENKCLASE